MKHQNVLKDCGFSEKQAEKYSKAVDSQDYTKQLLLLDEQRVAALHDLHVATKRIDCIDFLIYECKQNL